MGEKQRLRAALDVERGACNRLMDTADELRAEVARLLRENEALQSSEAESRAEVERMWGNVKALEVAVDANLATIADLRAELARYDVPLADGESLRTVGGWRALSDAERERWEWTLTGERRYGRWYTGDPPRFSVDCILIVRERVPAAPPEPPKVKAGQWIRPSSSDVRYLVASVGASNVSLVGFVWASLAHEGKSAAKAWVLSDACTHLDGEAE